MLGAKQEMALLFKKLATLRSDASLFSDVDELRWRGPTPGFVEFAQRFGPGSERLVERAQRAAAGLASRA